MVLLKLAHIIINNEWEAPLNNKTTRLALMALALVTSQACQQQVEDNKKTETEAFASTYAAFSAPVTAITNVHLLVGNGEEVENASLLMQDGKIVAVGGDIDVSDAEQTIDGQGKWLTPGIIDVHSHLGVYPAPSHEANEDGNEMTSPVTAEVWAEHSVWTQDPQMDLALAAGVTTLQVLPGSGNLIGGRGVTLKNVPARSVQEMKFPNAPHSLKMACGENPKRVYGSKGQAPMTRMGNVAGYRAVWIKAQAYLKKWQDYEKSLSGENPKEKPERDLQLETLAEVLKGNIRVHNHCYRAEEMAVMIDIAKEFGYKITAFHHAVEAYKIADVLAKENICAAMWADWWGFKQEAFDHTRENIAMVDKAGACAIVHSDSAIGIQHLNQEAAKVMGAANKMGLTLAPKDAIRWITLNAAKSLGVEEQTGSLEVGKMADLVLWDGNPFSIYSKTEKVFIDGALLYDRNDSAKQPVRDMNLGLIDPEGERL